MSSLQVFRAAALFALVLALCLGANAQALSGVAVSANPQSYTGFCPVDLHFTGFVQISRTPMVFNYQWLRSDGATTAKKMQRVNGNVAETRLVEGWRVGVAGQNLRLSMRLRVASGNTTMISDPAVVTIHCR